MPNQSRPGPSEIVYTEISLNFALIGCGLIGSKRAGALRAAGHGLRVAADAIPERAEQLADRYPECRWTADWCTAVSARDVDAVIVSTTNQWLAPVALGAVRAGKPVIVEKPAARSVTEIDPVISAASEAGVAVQVGFNHRYHPALRKARELVDAGALGPLLFLRGRYGHGGRLGYEKEWRADPEISGGGELIDQGVHLIDLARWFLGNFPHVSGHAATYFWKMPVDDNAFLSLRTSGGQTAWLHVSCSEWKNLFSLEIYGRDGKLDIFGLGGSYGVERITFHRMLPQMGPPESTVWEYPGPDSSWQLELSDFVRSIESGRCSGPTLQDARAALEVVELIYRRSGLYRP
jgi:predicted dehydrogenase